MEFEHTAGTELLCWSLSIVIHKNKVCSDSNVSYECGFNIGGGIDTDYTKSPQGYQDSGIYVTDIVKGGPAEKAGLLIHDKILQCCDYDFTAVSHRQAVKYIQKGASIELLVARKGLNDDMEKQLHDEVV